MVNQSFLWTELTNKIAGYSLFFLGFENRVNHFNSLCLLNWPEKLMVSIIETHFPEAIIHQRISPLSHLPFFKWNTNPYLFLIFVIIKTMDKTLCMKTCINFINAWSFLGKHNLKSFLMEKWCIWILDCFPWPSIG